jgi:probable rRNA maturation factor
VGVTFIGMMKMRQLNRQYRGLDRPTDVLSFAYEEESMEDGLPILGDIVLSPEMAFKNADRWRTDPDTEIRKLLLHGLLHLLGYDHEADQGEMHRLQRRFMRLSVFRDASSLVDIRGHR